MDMLWKQAAIERLKLYEPKRLSLKSIPQEIRRLELEMQSIRSATSDGSPSKGGGSGREDMLPVQHRPPGRAGVFSGAEPESGSL
ncbi:MAG: hypothetical protein ACLS4A_12755 [Oscillospiraceae bacterium]